jgi:hypothetical protein
VGAYKWDSKSCSSPDDHIAAHARLGRFAVWAINRCNVSRHFSFLRLMCLKAIIIGCFVKVSQVEKACHE